MNGTVAEGLVQNGINDELADSSGVLIFDIPLSAIQL